jgi:hypothetical protein
MLSIKLAMIARVPVQDLAVLLGACQIKAPRILLATDELNRANELAFVISSYMGGLGLVVLTKAKQANG